jgi:signal peptidase I
MTDDKQNESVKTYRPWVGVVLSFFITGASQFLVSNKFIGIGWFVIIGLLSFGSMFCLASPSIPGDMPAFILLAITSVLWIIMLVKSYRPIPRFRWTGWACFIFLILLLEALDLGEEKIVRPFKMPTSSMAPTIQGNTKRADGTAVGGDHIFAEEYAYWFSKPQRGDIVVFKTTDISTSLPENEFYIKRITGIPGDVLSVQDGHLFNHGQRVAEPVSLANFVISSPGRAQFFSQLYLAKATDTFVVSNDCYFVLGDNTTNSIDSRFFGAIPEKNIIGRVSKIYWPLNRAGKIQ